MYIHLFFTILRTWPLYLIYIFKTRLIKDEQACRWDKDISRLNEKRFFYVLSIRPYYRDLFYLRFRLPPSIFLPLFGGEELAIPRIDIGEGCYFEHPHGSHLNAVRIGKNFTCYHNVTIGNNHGGVPVLGDNVTIGCGACVLGDISIGSNVNIGANAVVLKDVPDNCTIVGNPSFIIKMNGEKVNIPLNDLRK